MDSRWRQGMIFAGGLALGGLVAALALLRPAEVAAPVAALPAPAMKVAQRTTPGPACDFTPVVAKAGRDDGIVRLMELGAVPPHASGGAAVLQGKEARAAGRDLDAEVAFINACRIAGAGSPQGSIEIADAKYQLARHYSALAQEGARNRAELLRRAKPLYEESLRIYLARLGDRHEKARFAAEGLASLKQESVQAPTHATRAPTPPAAVQRPRPQAAPTQAMGAAHAPKIVAQPEPSFDCEKARSTPEKLICGDAELAQLDRELGELHARAKQAAPDPQAFQRVSDREWRRRETECGDKDCLVRWYAERQRQLQEQEQAQPSPEQVSSTAR